MALEKKEFLDTHGVERVVGYLDNKIDNLSEDLMEDINDSFTMIAAAWLSTKAYAIDDICINDGKLWKCKVANTNVIPVEGTHWTSVSVSSTLADLKKSVADGKKSVATAISGKGVSTAANASFATMVTNIGKIQTDVKHTITISIGVINPDYRDDTAQIAMYVNGAQIGVGPHGHMSSIDHVKNRMFSASYTI